MYDGSFSDQTTEYIERLAYLHFLAFWSYIIQQMFLGFLSVKYNDSNGPKGKSSGNNMYAMVKLQGSFTVGENVFKYTCGGEVRMYHCVT